MHNNRRWELPFTKIGKVQAMMAAMIQCVKLPSELPCERTELGNISEMNTQITAPWDSAKNAIKQTGK